MRLNRASIFVKGQRDDPDSPEGIDASFIGRIAALNSTAIRLPSRVLGTKIRLPIGSSKYIQPIEVKVFCGVIQAIFGRQNKFFRCRQGGSIQVGCGPTCWSGEGRWILDSR